MNVFITIGKGLGIMNFADLKIEDLLNNEFSCSCNKVHKLDINKILIGNNIENDIFDYIKKFDKILMITDANINEAYAQNLFNKLENKDKIKKYTFEDKHLIPDERTIGKLYIEMINNYDLIIGVGSGVINDISRYISFREGIPYIIIATAPSMDGYASTVSPLVINGVKTTYEAIGPMAIFGELDTLKNAPREMIAAGLGDIVGKYTSLIDWKLSRIINNEYYCENCAEMIEKPLDRLSELIINEKIDNEEFVFRLIELLIISGISMGFIGNSRPASGSEHHLAHYWEKYFLSKGLSYPMHGHSVGVASLIISDIYRFASEKGLPGGLMPDKEKIRKMLLYYKTYTKPSEIGIDKELFFNSILEAKNIRKRYTIFSWLSEKGLLEEAAKHLERQYYI